MSKKNFITYADSRFQKAAKRLKKEVHSLGLFDSLYIYHPNDLPLFIKASFLFSFPRGGGYWIWKPCIILEKLKQMKEGDLLFYSDAGSKVYPAISEWKILFDYLKTYDAIFFQYKDREYNWGKPTLKYWMKKSLISHFNDNQIDEEWLEQPKFWAGAMFLKKSKKTVSFIEYWHDIIMLRPDLVFDTFGIEKINQASDFVEHRHDQAILSALLLSMKHDTFLYLQENCEVKSDNQCIFAARIKDEVKEPFKVRIKRVLKQKIGKKNINHIISLLKHFRK